MEIKCDLLIDYDAFYDFFSKIASRIFELNQMGLNDPHIEIGDNRICYITASGKTKYEFFRYADNSNKVHLFVNGFRQSIRDGNPMFLLDMEHGKLRLSENYYVSIEIEIDNLQIWTSKPEKPFSFKIQNAIVRDSKNNMPQYCIYYQPIPKSIKTIQPDENKEFDLRNEILAIDFEEEE